MGEWDRGGEKHTQQDQHSVCTSTSLLMLAYNQVMLCSVRIASIDPERALEIAAGYIENGVRRAHGRLPFLRTRCQFSRQKL